MKGSNPQVVLSGTEGEASGAGRGWGEGGDSSSWPGSQGADNRLVLISSNSSPTESKRLFYTSVSLLLSCI